MKDKEKLKRRCLKTIIIGSAIVCLGILIGVSVIALVLFESNIYPPTVVCTYSGLMNTTYIVKPTMTAHTYTSEVYSREGTTSEDYRYSLFHYKTEFESTTYQQGKVLTAIRPFFNRTMCLAYNEHSTCQEVTKGVQKVSWHVPCPSDPNITCDVYTAQTISSTSMYNETWYLFPKSMFPGVKKRVPSAYYIETEQYSSFNVFLNFSLEEPPDSVFQHNYSGYCYDVNGAIKTNASTGSALASKSDYKFDKFTSFFKPSDLKHISNYRKIIYFNK